MSYLILAGYNVAVPPSDSRVDIFAIKHGTQLSVAVSMAESVAPNEWLLTFPTSVEARFFAVISSDEQTLHLNIFDVPPELALAEGQRTGAGVEVKILKDRNSDYKIGGVKLRQLGSPWTEL